MRLGGIAGLVIAMTVTAQPLSGGVTPAKGLVATRCPGWLHANQHDVGGARTVWTTAFEDKDKKDKWWPEAGSMGVHVNFTSAQKPLQSMEFSVSYLPPGLHEMPANTEGKSVPELKKRYSLATRDRVRVEGDLLVGPASAVTRVRVTGATFADGSVWQAASEDACGVEPTRVLAVEGKESSLSW